jgi:hypothetical protein
MSKESVQERFTIFEKEKRSSLPQNASTYVISNSELLLESVAVSLSIMTGEKIERNK